MANRPSIRERLTLSPTSTRAHTFWILVANGVLNGTAWVIYLASAWTFFVNDHIFPDLGVYGQCLHFAVTGLLILASLSICPMIAMVGFKFTTMKGEQRFFNWVTILQCVALAGALVNLATTVVAIHFFPHSPE